jgi:hypothetical protein
MCWYEPIKSSIRLLVSTSNELTLIQLNADYQHYYQSKNIPDTNFGYSTLVNHSFFFINLIYLFVYILIFVSKTRDLRMSFKHR